MPDPFPSLDFSLLSLIEPHQDFAHSVGRACESPACLFPKPILSKLYFLLFALFSLQTFSLFHFSLCTLHMLLPMYDIALVFYHPFWALQDCTFLKGPRLFLPHAMFQLSELLSKWQVSFQPPKFQRWDDSAAWRNQRKLENEQFMHCSVIM